MFDCILATGLAKQGWSHFQLVAGGDLRRAAYLRCCRPHRSRLRVLHVQDLFDRLFISSIAEAHDLLYWQLLGLHNIHFYLQLMRTMRETHSRRTWLSFYHSQRDVLDCA